MNLAKSAALLLSTDLREVARKTEEVHLAQGVIVSNLQEAAQVPDLPPFVTIRLALLQEDVEETRDRLASILKDLTGRRPG